MGVDYVGTIHCVILNVVKNLLNDNTLSTLSMVGFEEIATSGKALLAMTIILSTLSLVGFEELKHLRDSTTV